MAARECGEDAREVSSAIIVESRPLISRLALVGKIEPGENITLVAPFDGTVKRKAVHEGQQVARGETLIVMDTTDIDVQLREAQAQWLTATRTSRDLKSWASSAEVAQARRRLSTAKLGFNETTRRVEETRRLFERGIVPKQELDTYMQQQELQKLDVAAAEAELAAALERGNAENREIARLELANAESKYLALKASRRAIPSLRPPRALSCGLRAVRHPGSAHSRRCKKARTWRAGRRCSVWQVSRR